MALALLVIPFAFIAVYYQTVAPFHLNGSQFLVFYPVYGITVIIAYAIAQKGVDAQVKQVVADHFPANASVFQVCKFLYGRHRAIQTAIVDLIRRNLLKVNSDQSMFVFSDNYVPVANEQNPLTEALAKEAHCSKVYYEGIATNWYPGTNFNHPAFENLYAFANRTTPFVQKGLFYVLLIGMGGLRIMQGVYNQRPFMYLFIEILVLGIALYLLSNFLSLKSRVFKNAAVMYKQKTAPQLLYTDAVVADFAANGPGAIAGFSEGILLGAVFSAYPAINWRSNNTNGGGSCSSCSGGTGDSGGGGSDGGGCGGGCGGCGGGD